MGRICRMGGRLGIRAKGLEDLNVYRHQQAYGEKVREDLNMQRRLGWPCEGQALALWGRGAFFSSCGGQAPAIAPSSCASCSSWPSCFRR